MTASGILPTHQRYLNGAPVPSSVRRSFRPREKYLILLVFLTFGLVCFGAFFFLPEFKSGMTGNSVYSVYQQIQKAGPELLIPAPPFLDEVREARKNLIHRHDVYGGVDPHRVEDKAKLLAKIEEDNERNHKVLERPEFDVAKPASSSTKVAESQQNKFDPGDDTPSILTVPPIYAEKYPLTYKGEDPDPSVRDKRNKVLEVS